MPYAYAEKDFYQRHYEGGLQVKPGFYDETYRKHFAPGLRYHLLTTLLEKNRQYGTLVEIGCATGDCLFYAAKEYKFKRVVGLDIAFPDDMKQQSVDGVEFVQANSNQPLPLADRSVDVLMAMMVIEHLFDPFHAFSEINRVLADDGVAVVNLPLVTSIKNRLRLLCGRVPQTSVGFDRWIADREWDGNHLHYFSVPSIRRLATACGLELTTMAGVAPMHKLKTVFPSFLANELTFVVRRAR